VVFVESGRNFRIEAWVWVRWRRVSERISAAAGDRRPSGVNRTVCGVRQGCAGTLRAEVVAAADGDFKALSLCYSLTRWLRQFTRGNCEGSGCRVRSSGGCAAVGQTGGWEIKRALTQKGRCGARTMRLVLANQGKDAQTLGIAAQLLHGIATTLQRCTKFPKCASRQQATGARPCTHIGLGGVERWAEMNLRYVTRPLVGP
jgi:hypothetical protein